MQEPADSWPFAHLVDVLTYEPDVPSLPHVVYQPSFRPHPGSTSNDISAATATEAGTSNGRNDRIPEGIENWPRRLLHVPSWTSLEWQPGNLYGQWTEPRFNALSYTWGRYQQSRKQKRGRAGMAFKVKGLPWSLASISPSHFRQENIMNAILHAQHIGGEGERSNHVQFLWIDQACIDQRPGMAQDAEIRRQAAIFKKAQEVYVWITRKDQRHLQESWGALTKAASGFEDCISFGEEKDQDKSMDVWLPDAHAALIELIQDPWFTSLWTLQEVSVRPDAKVLDKVGEHVKHGTSMATLQTLLDSCAKLDTACRKALYRGYYRASGHRSRLLRNIVMLLEISGLAAHATGNPINVYSVTRFRAADCERSYVHAVQGLFHSKDGTPFCELPPPTKNKIFLANELEWRLGAAFLERDPVLSQMHIFTEPPARGQAWRFNQTSWVPRVMGGGGSWDLHYEPLCSLTLHGDVESPCIFKGDMVRYEDLQRSYENGWETEVDSHPPLQIWLDASPFPPISVPLLDRHDRENPATKEDVNKLFQKHTVAHPEGELRVLLLGYYNSNPERANNLPRSATKRTFHVGLLIFRPCPTHSRRCRRIGFCVWQASTVAQYQHINQKPLVQQHVEFG